MMMSCGAEMPLFDQIVVGRVGILINARFIGLALALPVSAIIDGKDVDPDLRQRPHLVKAVANVLRVAMKPEEDLFGCGVRTIEGVDPDAICGLQPDVFNFAFVGLRVRGSPRDSAGESR